MRLDIRLPLGLLFVIFGILLTVFGLIGNRQIYERSLGININLWWGAIMLLFGLVLFAMGRRGHRRQNQTDSAAKAAQESR